MKKIVLNSQNYADTYQQMKTLVTDDFIDDQFWLLEHQSVYSVGLNKVGLRLPQNDIPIIYSNRGGKITYHGPGQSIIYTLINLQRLKLNINSYVSLIEDSIIDFLKEFDLSGHRVKNAPGIYIENRKIASIGLRLRKNIVYHGLSFNNNMDLTPFEAIDPCGYQGLEMCQLTDFGINKDTIEVADKIATLLINKLQNL
ncbi:MAG: lipoyl(octanoyl) transferase LipB [Nitrosomonadales bacterium]